MRYIKWYMVCGGLAQSVEQRNHNPSVAGSIPAPATTIFQGTVEKKSTVPFFCAGNLKALKSRQGHNLRPAGGALRTVTFQVAARIYHPSVLWFCALPLF